ncbi:hypothetical protein [Mesorhizobium sp. M0140]|uniref:hypothetical protein n=1 Tax=Mesorhizobium sp. M0140 TaxID=2956893 RepID=UPI00333844D6
MMASDRKHEAWLKFSKDILALAAGKSKEDLRQFRDIADFHHPAIAPIINAYLDLAIRSDSDVKMPSAVAKRPRRQAASRDMHLFDLLREKTFFPQNLDLARFAGRILPSLRTNRFDKMSRSDIAARIIEFIEASDPGTKQALESSMRDGLDALAGRPPKESERRSFLSKWESIIKGDGTAE